MFRSIALILLLSLLLAPGALVWAGDGPWEYQVVILQGVTAGGTIEKQSSGVYLDTKKTSALNALADEGWEVIAVVGAPGTDHAVYFRRATNR